MASRARGLTPACLAVLLVMAAGPRVGPASAVQPSASPTPTLSAPPSPTPGSSSPTPEPSPTPGVGSPGTSPGTSPGASPSPTPAPTATPRPEPLPRCAYADVITRDRDFADWATTFLDTTYRLPTTYVPPDLVATRVAGGGQVRRLVATDLRAMARAAAAAGAPFQVVSAYRSYGTQVYDFSYWVGIAGMASALLGSARAGHSEHQLGTTVDLTSLGGGLPWKMWDWGTTAAGRWARLNAWRFGFVMSYPPKGSPSRTCYRYEPWHFRYVGRGKAAAIHASGLTLREYLWRERGR